jgi:hypothetical protein
MRLFPFRRNGSGSRQPHPPHDRFAVHWVLVNDLAVGPAPVSCRHLDRLDQQGIKAVLSLCGAQEAPLPPELGERFGWERYVLPDHRAGRLPSLSELSEALERLEELRAFGPVYVHCLAGRERSPLICLAWMVTRHGKTPQRALDYLMAVHPDTNPLPGQLALLDSLCP